MAQVPDRSPRDLWSGLMPKQDKKPNRSTTGFLRNEEEQKIETTPPIQA